MVFGFGRSKEIPQEEILFEDFWSKNEDVVKQAIETSLNSFANHPKYEEVAEERLAIEQEFCKSIFDLLAHAKPDEVGKKAAILLFDIDGTLGYHDSFDEQLAFKMRPSVPLLMEQVLKPLKMSHRLDIGLLSTRSIRGMNQQLSDPNELGALHDYIDKEYIFFSTGDKPINDPNPKAYLAEKHTSRGTGVISDELLIDPSARSANGDMDKVDALARVANDKKYKQRRFLIADDLPYTRLLEEKRGMHGADIQSCTWDDPVGVRS